MEPVVEREVQLDARLEEVWAALAEVDTWLADDGSLELRPGAEGTLTDDGVARRAVVDAVDEHRRVVLRWWTDDASAGRPAAPFGFVSRRYAADRSGLDVSTDSIADDASRIELTLVPTGPAGESTRLVVRETPLWLSASSPSIDATSVTQAETRVRSGLWWEVRLACLAFSTLAARATV